MREPKMAKPRNYRKTPNSSYPVKAIGFIYTNRDPNIMSKVSTKGKSEHRWIFISKLF